MQLGQNIMNSEVYLSTHFKNDLEKLPLSEQKRIAEIIDLLEKDPIANSLPVSVGEATNSAVREVRTSQTRIVLRNIPEESAVILTGLYVGTLLSDDQMLQLAQSFHDTAVALAQIRLDAVRKGGSLTDTRLIQLQGYVLSLQKISSNLAIEQANLTINDPVGTTSVINSALSKAEAALEKNTNLDIAIQIASSVIVLGASISTRNVELIRDAAESVSIAAELAGRVAHI
jgi:mRNA-degrading endonuclease RelE of RelBE toxin-antitoxin system